MQEKIQKFVLPQFLNLNIITTIILLFFTKYINTYCK